MFTINKELKLFMQPNELIPKEVESSSQKTLATLKVLEIQ
jgi:hypothetical protein